MPAIFETPEAKKLYAQLVAKHGKPVAHDLMRIFPRSKVRVWVSGHGHLVTASSLANQYACTRYDHTKDQVHNVESRVTKAPAGTGTKMTARQVMAARQAGVHSIHIGYAAGSGSGGENYYNGYYTWPRLGFNAPLEHAGRADPQHTIHPDFHSLFSTEEGAASWKRRGVAIRDMSFDPHPDSEHSKRLLAYMKSKGIKV